ncbi:UbiA family prenyltransferase [Azospirillum picis]|uniref:4-hydroxybenzoate polyprenyltransferase n=1 Tax=Azospirillum picis TaxID=488438 RepID=A0ABU0MMT8_9PROT|nr:UbiA family prenyltransferase [Azospirillum picis]MBP2300811.1 4-hydroxybenzoate polyprenyltransferase [Azospirillum picis]MDQ0534780.1 4-hydroxybenzoate polyprenyltransferase [Azospirillum picis]
MGFATAVLIRPRAALVLGRVSNLPTVVSNALAGLALAGTTLAPAPLLDAILALTLFYVGGMYLNDAFDAAVDARGRPGRPIPRGDAARGAVFVAGFALVALGVALAAHSGPVGAASGTALAVAILLYDVLHKKTALAPVIMGVCRFLAYAMAAGMAGAPPGTALLLGAAGLFCHVVGLTCAARQEAYDRLERAWPLAMLAVPLLGTLAASLQAGGGTVAGLALWIVLLAATAVALFRLFRRAPGDVPRAVALLIAAIALYDAILVAVGGGPGWAVALATLCFPATLALQRLVPGT